MLWQPLADPTSRNPTGFGETAGRNSGVRFKIRRAQDEDPGYSERLQLLSENIDQSISGATGKCREGPRGRQWARQPNVLVLRPRDTHASCSESRDHYFLDGRKWYRLFSFYYLSIPSIYSLFLRNYRSTRMPIDAVREEFRCNCVH